MDNVRFLRICGNGHTTLISGECELSGGLLFVSTVLAYVHFVTS